MVAIVDYRMKAQLAERVKLGSYYQDGTDLFEVEALGANDSNRDPRLPERSDAGRGDRDVPEALLAGAGGASAAQWFIVPWDMRTIDPLGHIKPRDGHMVSRRIRSVSDRLR